MIFCNKEIGVSNKMTMLKKMYAEPAVQVLIEKIHLRMSGCSFQYKTAEQLGKLRKKQSL